MITQWWLAARPKTLTAALVPIILGSTLAYVETGFFSGSIFLFALLSAFSIQIGTNLFNDALDFKKGADTQERIGPKRVTQSGVFTYKQVSMMGALFFVLAFLFGIPLVVHGGMPIVVVGLSSLFMGYAYTGGPAPLAYNGLGDFFVVSFFGVIAVCGVYYLQSLSLSPAALVAGLQVGFLATVLIVINNMRDIDQDKIANKKTLAVRFGRGFCFIEIVSLIVASFALGLYWLSHGLLPAVLPCLLLPLALSVISKVRNARSGDQFNKLLEQSAGLHLLFGTILSFALML